MHVCDARGANVPQLLRIGEVATTGGGELPAPAFKCLRAREQKVEYEVSVTQRVHQQQLAATTITTTSSSHHHRHGPRQVVQWIG